MDNTAVLIIVGVLVLAAIAAAAGLFDRTRRVRRRSFVERPAERVVQQPVVQQPVVQQPAQPSVVEESSTTRRVVE